MVDGQSAISLGIVGTVHGAVGITLYAAHTALIVEHPYHTLLATYKSAIGAGMVAFVGKVDKAACMQIVTAIHVGTGAHPQVALIVVGEHVAHHAMDRVAFGPQVVDVVEVVAIVSAQAVGGGHPDIAVGILCHVEYLIAWQAIGRTDMAAVG